jgi:hypothetical protein
MAYEIEILEGDPWLVQLALTQTLGESRFWAHSIRRGQRGKREVVSLHKIRLKNAKGYCGNHPGACALTGDANPHNRRCFLEGADWVAFHDMVNDLLDAAGVSANVHTMGRRFWIRRGWLRRRRFWGSNLNTRAAVFDLDDPKRYVDNRRGAPMRSEFPDGTPGIPEWRLVSEENHAPIFVKHGARAH